jgi:hypothetical protein
VIFSLTKIEGFFLDCKLRRDNKIKFMISIMYCQR